MKLLQLSLFQLPFNQHRNIIVRTSASQLADERNFKKGLWWTSCQTYLCA